MKTVPKTNKNPLRMTLEDKRGTNTSMEIRCWYCNRFLRLDMDYRRYICKE